MAIRVLAAGVLATDERHGREVIVTRDTDLDREQARARLLFERLGDAHGTRAQTAIRYALTNPELSTLVVGVATLEQLDEALAAIEAGPLPDDALGRDRRWPRPGALTAALQEDHFDDRETSLR